MQPTPTPVPSPAGGAPELAACAAAIVDALHVVAPEADPGAIAGDDDWCSVLELDSVDFLTVVERAGDAVGVTLAPERYGRLATLDGFAAELAEQRRRAQRS